MEQQQFKVSFPLGTKLLLSVLLLLGGVIAFLNGATIFLLREDKRAYTYQSQSTQAVLAGRELVTRLRHDLDTLKIALSQLDPLNPITPQQTGTLQSLVNNQSDLVAVSVNRLDLGSAVLTQAAHAMNSDEAKRLHLGESDLALAPDRIKSVLEDLERDGYAFVNLSRVDGTPALGVLAADTRTLGNPAGVPVALGLASLKEFGSDLSGGQLSIATRSGVLLFDTDPTALYSVASLRDDPLYKAAFASKLASGAHEFEAGDKHYLGSYVQPGLGLLVFSKADWKKAIRSTYDLIIKFMLLGGMAIGVALVFAIVFSRTLTRPIHRLYEATREIARGNFGLDIQIGSRDEIGALTGSFNQMSRQIHELMASQAEKIHLENELFIASTVQQTLIPPPVFQNSDVYIHSHYQSASQCGGDWWGFFGVDRKLCIMIADATGHGMPSALITASARSCFSVLQKIAQEDPLFSFSPGAMLSYANRVIYDASLGKIMMTFFVAVIDFDKMTLTFASAGHNPPWLFKKEDDSYTLQSLVAVGRRLGEIEEMPPFAESSLPITPGDILFMYTDGLTEGKNAAGEMFGKKRVRKAVQAGLSQGPKVVIESLMAEFLAHNGSKPLDDDVTLAVAKIGGL